MSSTRQNKTTKMCFPWLKLNRNINRQIDEDFCFKNSHVTFAYYEAETWYAVSLHNIT